MLATIALKPLFYKGRELIGLFTLDQEVGPLLKRLPGAGWLTPFNCWSLPLSKQSYLEAKKTLEGKAELDVSALRQYLEQKNALPAEQRLAVMTYQRAKALIEQPLNEANLKAF